MKNNHKTSPGNKHSGGIRLTHIMAATVVIIVGLAVYRLSESLSNKPHLEAARRALEKRDFRQATIDLKKHLQENRDDSDALLLAAQTARRHEDYLQFRDLLNEYEKKGGSKESIDLEKTLAQLQQGELSEVTSLLERCESKTDAAEVPLIIEAIIVGSLKVIVPAILKQVENPDGGNPRPNFQAEYDHTLQAANLWLNLRSSVPDQVQGLNWRGKIHVVGRNFSEAETDFEKALAIDDGNTEGRLMLAKMLSPKHPNKALEHLEQLNHDLPGNEEVRHLISVTCTSLGHLERAATILDELLAANPRNFTYLVERGRIALDQRQVAQAERWLLRALALSPKNAELNRIYSQCLKMAGREDEAKRFWQAYEQARKDRKQ